MAKEQDEELSGKEKIELNWPGDGRLFLNFWDWAHGNDVVCEIVDDKLMLHQHDGEGNSLPHKEVTFQEYLALVVESVKKREI